jgi:hypothetical protein
MALPATVRVKLSSEAAGAISLTPVVVQELALRELVEHVLGITGKDEPRLREVLLRGTLVSGGSRFRWAGWDVDLPDLRDILATFPDPDPGRRFDPAFCEHVVLRGGRQAVAIPKTAACRSGALSAFFRRAAFWDHLMEVAAAAAPVYSGYSYRDRADRYLAELAVEHVARLRSSSRLIRYNTLRRQVQSLGFTQAELLVRR